MLPKPQAIEASVTELGKANLARAMRCWRVGFKSLLDEKGIVHFTVRARRQRTACIQANLTKSQLRLESGDRRNTVQEKKTMTTPNRWATTLAAIASACALVACGGGGSTDSGPGPVAVTPQPSTPVVTVTPEAGAPASVGNIAIDGRNRINFRRAQVGIATLPQNALIDHAAQAHSDYQKLNNEITHDEVSGKPGFTGTGLKERLNFAGYTIPASGYAYGEVISATNSNSGFFMAEELITAIYHRFVIFEPQFKEIGSGSATTSAGYTYFTTDFGARNGYGQGIGIGQLVVWPFNGQTAVTTNFFSDSEIPDPVPEKDSNGKSINEVGYPISVHGDFSTVVVVQSFTVQPRGGSALTTKLLQHSTDAETEQSAAAIIPMAPLKSGTTYDVAFSGTVDGLPVTKSWSFTTK
jgi:uncharacterized protein YkwD